MASGSFLVGENLSISGFNHYILPLLKKRKISLTDIISIKEQDDTLLVSLTGSDIEKDLNESLIETGKELEKFAKDNPQFYNSHNRPEYLSYAHQVRGHEWQGKGEDAKSIEKGKYKIIGTYQDDKTASLLFPSLAQISLANTAGKALDALRERARSLLDKKLKDL